MCDPLSRPSSARVGRTLACLPLPFLDFFSVTLDTHVTCGTINHFRRTPEERGFEMARKRIAITLDTADLYALDSYARFLGDDEKAAHNPTRSETISWMIVVLTCLRRGWSLDTAFGHASAMSRFTEC